MNVANIFKNLDPTGDEVDTYHDENGKEVITHNIGTGLAGLSIDHLLVIEEGLQSLIKLSKGDKK